MSTAGLDLGPTRAAFARLKVSGTTVTLAAAALVALDGADDEGSRAAALAAALGAAGRGTRPRLGVPGRDAILRYLHLPNVPEWRLRLLMQVEVEDVAEKAGEALSADYRKLWIPDDIAGSESASVLVALAKEPALLGRLGALEAVGLRTSSALPTSIALFDAYVGLGHVDEDRTVILVDAGPDGTELAIARDGLLVFARGLPAHRDAGAAEIGAREAQQLAGAVASSVQFCRSQQKLRALPVDAVRVSGAYARSPELLQALRQTLKVEVTTFDPLERLDTSQLPADALAAVEGRGPELALAVGLALATSHPRCVSVDLTPKPILARRAFLTRTVFLYAAGALLTVALGFALVNALVARGAVLARRAEVHRIHDEAERRREAIDAQARANKRNMQVIDTLGKRTQTGGAALRLLARLREATPPRVTVAELALEQPAPAAGRPAAEAAAASAAAGEVPFRLKGEVDNAAGDAIRLLGRFEAGLREDPGVVSAKVTGTPVEQPGAVLEFVLVVVMRAQARGAED